jgi:hypothetical protein
MQRGAEGVYGVLTTLNSDSVQLPLRYIGIRTGFPVSPVVAFTYASLLGMICNPEFAGHGVTSLLGRFLDHL